MVTRLGNVLYTSNSTVKTLIDMEKIGKAAILDINSNSAISPILTWIPFANSLSRILENTSGAPTSVIRISDGVDRFLEDSLYAYPNKYADDIKWYKLLYDEQMNISLSIYEDTNITTIKIRHKNMITNLGSTLFPGLCKSKT
jgi:hypothetical protein